MTEKELRHKDLIWHPGTGEMTPAQLAAMHTRHAGAIRPIPSATALGHEHLMADADRGALLAEVERLRSALTALGRNERAAISRSLELQDQLAAKTQEAQRMEAAADFTLDAGVVYAQEVQRLERVVEQLKEINERLAAERERLEDEIKVHALTLGAVRQIVFEDAALSWEHRVRRLAQLLDDSR